MASTGDINEAEKEPVTGESSRKPASERVAVANEPHRYPAFDPRKAPELNQSQLQRLKVAGLVLLAMLSGFFGSWIFSQSGLVSNAGTTTIKESKERVLAEGEVVSAVAEAVSPSVVSIITESTSNSALYGPVAQEGAGTGVIISKDGYILTNKHVIPESVQSVTVELADGTSYDNVEVIGRDPINDLAFLKISGVNDLKPAKLGDSSKMDVGQNVVAIGNALGQYQTTVTSGIISGVGRPVVAGDGSGAETETLSNLFQTDAAINPGNSGGPLVNMNDEVIGINVAVASNAQGIGFAIPINDAKGLIESVLTTGKVTRPYIGVRYVMLSESVARDLGTKQTKGAYVGPGTGEAVVSGSPADKAGLKKGDIITKVDGKELNDGNSLATEISQHRVGDTVTLTVLRGGKEQQIKLTLASYGG